jgi:hypothetical protein
VDIAPIESGSSTREVRREAQIRIFDAHDRETCRVRRSRIRGACEHDGHEHGKKCSAHTEVDSRLHVHLPTSFAVVHSSRRVEIDARILRIVSASEEQARSCDLRWSNGPVVLRWSALGADDQAGVDAQRSQPPIGRVAERRIEISLRLGNLGYDPTYGARPLKRVIQRNLVDPLALGLLQGDYADGDRVVVDAVDGELRFERTRAASHMRDRARP